MILIRSCNCVLVLTTCLQIRIRKRKLGWRIIRCFPRIQINAPCVAIWYVKGGEYDKVAIKTDRFARVRQHIYNKIELCDVLIRVILEPNLYYESVLIGYHLMIWQFSNNQLIFVCSFWLKRCLTIQSLRKPLITDVIIDCSTMISILADGESIPLELYWHAVTNLGFKRRLIYWFCSFQHGKITLGFELNKNWKRSANVIPRFWKHNI